MFNPLTTKTQAEQIEASITETEAPAWLKMLAWAVLPPSQRRSGLASDPAIASLPSPRVNEMLAAVNCIVRFHPH
jgi:hypothetical protein